MTSFISTHIKLKKSRLTCIFLFSNRDGDRKANIMNYGFNMPTLNILTVHKINPWRRVCLHVSKLYHMPMETFSQQHPTYARALPRVIRVAVTSPLDAHADGSLLTERGRCSQIEKEALCQNKESEGWKRRRE